MLIFFSSLYRIEFQVRGLPHLHGVFWLKQTEARKYQDENGEFSDSKVPALINKWISCSLDTGNEDVRKLVKEVNVHKHTNSCKKGNNPCRFSFPRLPSNKTLISNPLPEDDLDKISDDKKKKEAKAALEKKKNDAKEILEKVKKKITGNAVILRCMYTLEALLMLTFWYSHIHNVHNIPIAY